MLPHPWENVEGADWIHLSEDEEVRWTGRPSRFTIAIPVVGGLAIAIAGIALAIRLRPEVAAAGVPGWVAFLPLVLTLAGLGWAVTVSLDWLRLLYAITDEVIYVKHGLISRDVTGIRLERVQNTSFEQSVPQRMLRFGDVRIYTAGTGTEDLVLENVPNPEGVCQLLTELLSDRFEARRRDVHRGEPDVTGDYADGV